ncbi:hypothetical protein [Flavobacterium johnsoniae]|uniref:Phage protein D n=1 Tax=Flavobacterium johnsoniae TaxID=986 RepID=A0A1M5VIW9_FLAJO|nr:hypothetical protein [Flavobacterium johnsoniae]SHH75196.1 hypothetical protein SAMN05444388_1187 [Flavobacterium johnsoniae]
MILALTCKIVFHKNEHHKEDIVMYRVTEIEVESTWKEMTSRGSITLPRNVRYFDKYNVREVFRRGDQVTVYFGYNGNNEKEFIGYISEVSADIPIVLKMEDEMFKVRKIPVNFSSKNISLKNLLETIIPGYEIDALEGVQLGAVRLSKTGVGPVLEKLQSSWGLYSYMRGKTVVCGKYYADESEYSPVNFNLERNCVSTSLNYKKKEDISLKIKVVSTLSNGKKISVENIGDKDGNERQLTFYNIEIKAELERLGKLEYEKYKVDRFEGSFTAFGIPSVRHGLKVNLKSGLYQDRNGKYYIEKVVKKFSPSGIRQEITLGDKVA